MRLVDRGRDRADRVVLSRFVNPLQFGPSEDFDRYPRDLERDRRLAASRSVDCFFNPDTTAVYPEQPVVFVDPGAAGDILEGAARPGHFRGVLTVVAKLFHYVEPDVAIFGRKDYQQCVLVRRMVSDLHFSLELDIAPTVRELDGLALSSRNVFLKPDERRSALALSRALRAVEQAWRGGQADPAALERRGLEVLAGPGVVPDYLKVLGAALNPIVRTDAASVVVVAARVGATRLIDNVVLGEGMANDVAVRTA